MMLINYSKYEERGEELKVPHYASTAAVHDGNLPHRDSNMPHVKATYLI